MIAARWFLCLMIFAACSGAAQAGFVIDSWVTPQTIVLDGVNVGSAGGEVTGAGIFGNGRGYSLGTFSAAESMNIGGGTLTMSVTPSNSSFEGSFQFNFIDSTPSESVPLVDGYVLQIADIVSNSAWNVAITFKGTPNTATTSYNTIIAANTNSTLQIPFTVFNNPISGLGPISEISVLFTSNSGVAPQLTLGAMSVTTVPEPSILLLSMVSIAGVIFPRWRRSMVQGSN